MMTRHDLQQAFARNRSRYIDEWREFLRFPSISTDPAHHEDCLACAHWLTQHLAGLGFDAKLLATPTKPVVYAEHKGRPDRPVVLFYGHYDVQPVDPLAEWTTPPFEPAERNGRLYARGADDNKGQVFYVLKALETLVQHAALDGTVRVLIEGEEESGSQGIAEGLRRWRNLLQADILMVCDTGMVRGGAPTIVMGLRGVAQFTATLSGPSHDLHSGLHGGAAPNPAAGLARLLASLHHPDGSIAVEGFCDGLLPASDEERALANASAFDPDLYERETGVRPVGGERGLTPQERVGFRPTIEINGIHGGYGGAGGKTIIPARALAKISIRLAPGQDPQQSLDRLAAHLRRHTPEGLRLELSESIASGPGFRLNVASPLVGRVRGILDTLTDQPTALLWEGASIPIVAALAKVSGAEPLLVGFGREEDRVHAPDESFGFDQFELGYLYAGLLLGGA